MIRIERILLPIDFSESGESAIEVAYDVAEQFEAELHLLHVVEEIPPPDMVWRTSPADDLKAFEQEALGRLNALPGELWRRRLRIVRSVRRGPAVADIVKYAEEKECDLIVIGTHGRSGFARVVIGSVAEQVIREAPCAVLTVRPGVRRPVRL